jgi:riboflavin kinase/FMN adenylyltransferase
MDVVDGVEGLRPEHGPVFAVIGVFDGLHRGHAYLLEHLVREAGDRRARPAVITFDHHPDEVLLGSAPPLLLDPRERLERLERAGVDVAVIQPFDETVRRIEYDEFVDLIQQQTTLAGLLMTPDAAFGHERRGTPDTVAVLGRQRGFDLVVVPPFTLDERPVSSSAIRGAISSGDLAGAERLLGRPFGLRATANHGRLTFDWPMAMPPDGSYRCRVEGRQGTLDIAGTHVWLRDVAADGSIEVTLVA